jgi:hypothetical protein
MSKMDKKPTQNRASPGARQPYAQPKLKELGQVSALTQSGTGNNAEMVDPMGPMAAMESMN